MKTSLKAGFAQIFFAAQKIWVAQNLGGLQPPSPPPPARTPMLKSEPGSVSMGIHLRKLWSFKGRYSHLTWVDKFHLTFPLKIPALFLFSPSRSFRFFSTRTPGGEYFKNFWVGMCRWDPGTLNLYQNQFSWILLHYTRVYSPNPPYLRVAVFQKLLRSLGQFSQNKTLYHNHWSR